MKASKNSKTQNRRNLWVSYIVIRTAMNGTGTRRQFIPKAARLSSRAAFAMPQKKA
jgi:hypothetical protein